MDFLMDKLKMHTPDMTQDNIARIRELFPNCVTEAKDKNGNLSLAVDFDALRQELSNSIVEGERERYQLDWPGKKEAKLAANAPIAKTLRPCRDESVDFNTTQNLFIEGDNLDALKLLQESYLGKVKMIYIDPPYNTGSDFIYEDDFAENTQDYLKRSSQKNETGRLVANTESNGRFHSDWLSMMYPRLIKAKFLLNDMGAIFVSCDENEVPRLRLLMDDVFGQSNFVADMVWASGKKNDSRFISISHEYIICYAKNISLLKEKNITWRTRKKGLDEIYSFYKSLIKKYGNDYTKMTFELKKWYKDLPDNHPSKAHKHYCYIDCRGIYFPADISWPGGGGPKYPVYHPATKKQVKTPSRGWVTPDPKKMQAWIAEGRVHFGEDENSVPCLKKYLKESEYETPYSIFYQDGRASSKRLRTLMGGDYFGFPKDEFIIQQLIEFFTKGEDLILDFFAGSSTTAHAVMQLNAEDGGNRRFIMVQLPEVCDEKSEAARAGYKTIAEISKERIRRAGKKIKEELAAKETGVSSTGQGSLLDAAKPAESSLDTGFRVLKVDSSNMNDVFYNPDAVTQKTLMEDVSSIKYDRSDEDLLFQVLLDWGVDLSLPIRREKRQGTGQRRLSRGRKCSCCLF